MGIKEMKYIKLFENDNDDNFINLADLVDQYYNQFFDEKTQEFDDLIEILESIKNNIDDMVQSVESDIVDDIVEHINKHPYINVYSSEKLYQNIYDAIDVNSYDAIKDKFNVELIDNEEWIENVLRAGIEEEPMRYKQLKNIHFFGDLDDLIENILSDYKYLDRGDKSNLWNNEVR